MKTYIFKAEVEQEEDGRITVIHYHHSNDTLPRKTLRSVLEATRWTIEDLRRLALIV